MNSPLMVTTGNSHDGKKIGRRVLLVICALLLVAGFGYWGYQHHFFGSAATVAQRFPGDPNPLKSGKVYWGVSTSQSSASTMTYEQATGKSLGIHRVFSPSWSGIAPGGKLPNDLKNDRAHNRLTWLSTRPPCEGWQAVANGKYDGGVNGLDQFLKAIDADGRPVWLTMSHEPEDDLGTPSCGPNGIDGGSGKYGTAANWRAMQSHVRARMTALGIKHVAYAPILMGFTFQTPTRDPSDWWVPGIWNFFGVDIYQQSTTTASGFWGGTPWPKVLSWVKGKGLPIGIGEWGIDLAQPDAGEVSELQEFIDRNFAEGNDVLDFAYYDHDNFALSGPKLTRFNSILQNDTRLLHMSDLGSTVTPPAPPTGDTTAPSVAFTAPAANASVSGVITITASASDNVGVTKVNIFADSNVVKNDTFAGDGWSSQWNSQTLPNGAHTLKLVAYDAAGNTATVTRAVTINNPTTAPPSVTSFSANPATITTGQATTFNWVTVNTVSCNITPSGPTNTTANSWTTLAQSTTGTKTYTLTCRNSAGATASKSASFTVNPAPTPPTGVTLNASSTTVKSGTNVVFSWNSAGSTSCTLNPGGYQATGISSSKTLTMTNTTSYTVTCNNAAGSTTSNKVTVTVTSAPVPLPPPTIVSFVASPSNVVANGMSTLTWQTSNVAANGCSVAPSPLSTTAASGSWTTPPLSNSASYTLTCKNSANVVTSKSLSVAVANTPIPAAPAPVDPGTIESTTTNSSSNAGARVIKATTGQKVVDAKATPTVKSTDKITLDASSVTDQKVVDSVLKVEFYDGEKLIKTVTTAPFVLDPATLPHGTLAPGSHSLTQRTYYKDGSVSEQTQLIEVKPTAAVLPKPDHTKQIVTGGSALAILLLLACAGVWYFGLRPRGIRLRQLIPRFREHDTTVNLPTRPDQFFFDPLKPDTIVTPTEQTQATPASQPANDFPAQQIITPTETKPNE